MTETEGTLFSSETLQIELQFYNKTAWRSSIVCCSNGRFKGTIFPRINISCAWTEQVNRTWSAVNILWLNVPLVLYRCHKVTFFFFFLYTVINICFTSSLPRLWSFPALRFDVIKMSLASRIVHKKLSVLRTGQEIHVSLFVSISLEWTIDDVFPRSGQK